MLTRDDADTDRISQRLRYPVTGRNHLGVVAWREAGTDAADDLAEAAAAWLRAAGAAEVLVLNRAESAVWAWGATPSPPRSVPTDWTHSGGVRIGHGTWHPGLQGFRLTHREARSAEHVAHLCPRIDSRVVDYRGVDLLAVLLENPERAKEFAARELGPLAADDERSRELRETIRHYLELCSPKAVAERMFLARGTVAYRLRQAEQALERSLSERRLQLWTALVLADAIPPVPAER